MSEDRFATVKVVLAALNARDVDAYIACCTEDVEFVPATVAVSGTYTGASGIRRFFQDLETRHPTSRSMPVISSSQEKPLFLLSVPVSADGRAELPETWTSQRFTNSLATAFVASVSFWIESRPSKPPGLRE